MVLVSLCCDSFEADCVPPRDLIDAAVPPVFHPRYYRVLSRHCTRIHYLELVVLKLGYLRIASAVVVRRECLSETCSTPQDSQPPLRTTSRRSPELDTE